MGECAVCLDVFRDPMITPCGHTYCRQCMDALITIRSGRTFQQREIQCPECRTIFKRSDAKPNVSLSRMLVDHHRRHHPTALASAPLPAPASVEDTLPIGGPPPPRLSDAYALELMELGATPALLSTLVDREAAVGVRMFLLDNSGSTDTWDGSTLRLTSSSATTPEGERQGAKYTLDSATRWDEIKQVARDHARHNLELNHVCEFHLLNSRDPSKKTMREGADFVRLAPEDGLTAGLAALDRMLNGTRPNGTTPLAESLSFMNQRIARYAPALQEQGKMMYVVVVTDGIPTPLTWNWSVSSQQMHSAKQRAVNELYQIVGRFPVSLVVRLCTNDDEGISFWNNLDEEEEFALDVIDDLKGEAVEIYGVRNGFFVYTPALHRIREGGFPHAIFDRMDEKRLAPPQQAELLRMLLVDRKDGDGVPLPPPTAPNFKAEVKARAKKLPSVWDPRTNRLRPVAGDFEELHGKDFFIMMVVFVLIFFGLRMIAG
eukprot:m.181218 g.181218  ORF g.181218 m.181218 type:complete len:489 (+) comp15192_c0_seq1:96-1562(+)